MLGRTNSDLVIEQTLMRSLKSTGGLTRGSGMTEDMINLWTLSAPVTVQITFIFIGQTHLVFGKRVCTCVMKHSNAFRTFLNWLKNSKRVWHERKLHIMRVPLFANFDR